MHSRDRRNEAAPEAVSRSASPPLRQKTFPHRRRTVNRRNSGTPRLVKQTTLTQLPDFFPEPPLCSGRGAGVDEETPRPTKRRRTSRWERNQKTLTQLGHVQFILPSDEEESEDTEEGSVDDDEDLYAGSGRDDEEEAEGDYDDQLYRVKEEEAEEGFVGSPEISGIDGESTAELQHDRITSIGRPSQKMSPSPRPARTTRDNPQTPRRTSVLEVPSSQSPPESPLLTQPQSQHFRSPLGSRDPNTRQASPSPSKRPMRSVAPSKARSPEKQREHDQQEQLNPLDERHRTLRRMRSFIQDSNEGSDCETEDEEGSDMHITSERFDHASAFQAESHVENPAVVDDRSLELGDDIDGDCGITHEGLEENTTSHLEPSLPPGRDNEDPTPIASPSQKFPDRAQGTPVRGSSGRNHLYAWPREPLSANPVFHSPRKPMQNEKNPLPQSPHPSQATTTDSTQDAPRTQRYTAQALHPSQATTVDTTQDTPRTQRHPTHMPHQSQISTADHTQERFQKTSREPTDSSPGARATQQPPSSPYPMPPSLSSPLHRSSDRRDFAARPWRFGEGKVITASQLLPDSIIDFSIPPPPAWTQEFEGDD